MKQRIQDLDRDPNGDYLYQKLGYSIDVSIKRASADTTTDLPNEAFAWPERRLFRIDNEKVAAVNSVYVSSQRGSLPEKVVSRMEDALGLYKLSWPAIEKVAEAEDPEDYIFPDHKRLLIKSAEDVKSAEKILLSQKKTMNIPTRTYAFNKLLEKAASFGVELNNDVYKYCGISRTNTRHLREQLYKRAKYLKPSELKRAVLFMGDKLEKQAEILEDPEAQKDLASTLYELDKQAGFLGKYNRSTGFEDPVLAVYNTEKRASDFMNLAGKEVPVDQVMGLDPRMVADVVGDDFLEDVMHNGQVNPEEMKDVIETLPSDLKGRLVSYLGL